MSWTNIKVKPTWKGWEIERQQTKLHKFLKEEENGKTEDN